ncbi:hypothetical protein FQZ97_948030 [compost metagenome]
MAAAAFADRQLTFQFGLAVNPEGAGSGAFIEGGAAATIEYIISGVVHQPGIQLARGGGQHCDSLGVYPASVVDVAFGLVHGGIGARVDDHIRALAFYQRCQPFEVCQVTVLSIADDQFTQRGKGALQFPADLAICAEQENLVHAYCFPTHSRYAPLVTLATQSWFSRYQRTVLRMPVSKVSAGFQPSSRSSRDASMA